MINPQYQTILLLTFGLLLAAGCDQNFEEVNVNPVEPTSIDPVFLFSDAQNSLSYTSSTFIFQSAIVQQTMHPFLGVLAGGNVNQRNPAQEESIWNQYYGAVKHLVDVLDKTRDVPGSQNLYHAARIWKAFAFSVLTDTYGNVPYTEAGLGYLGSAHFPRYDQQPEIYEDLFRELREAVAGLDPGRGPVEGDLLFQGDAAKWQRFGNALLLRLGMRLVRADPGRARAIVRLAYEGGVLQSNDDNAAAPHSEMYINPASDYLNGTEKANFFLNETFVNYLRENSDPRLAAIAVVYGDATKNPDQTTSDHQPASQIGMPTGYDDQSITTAPGFPGSLYRYSQINRRTLGRLDAPCFHLTYAQTQLLLAEAAQRGWIGGDPAAFYRAGVRAHMEQLAVYGAGAAIDPAAIDAYLTARPYDPGKGLEQINYQYWVASLLNGVEAFANWRRSGFPILKPNNYPAQDIPIGQTVRRLGYPVRESAVNEASYYDAVADQGPDELNTPVWWDK